MSCISPSIAMAPHLYTITCPHCQRPIEYEAARRRCRFCGGDIRREVWRSGDPHSLLSAFGYKMAGLGLGAWGGVLLWTMHNADPLRSDHLSRSDVGPYLVFGALAGLLLTTLGCRIIRPHQRRMFERVLGALWIGIFGTLLVIVLHSPSAHAALPLLLGITGISYGLLSVKHRRSARSAKPAKTHAERLSERPAERPPMPPGRA